MVFLEKKVIIVLLLILLLNTFCLTEVVFASNDVDIKINKNKLTVEMEGLQDSNSAWNNFLGKYRNFIVGVAGVGSITMVILFIKQFIKLGASSDNPVERSRALQGILWTGIATAGLGAVAIIVGFLPLLFY
mgnify:FL=1